MKRVILLASLLCYPFLSGCCTGSSAVASDSPSQASEYEVVGMLTLNVGNGIKSQATIESLKESISAIPGQKPRSRLVITNLSSGKIIYQEECGDSTLSYPGFDIGHGAGLVVTTKGGSGDGIGVYEACDSTAAITFSLLELLRKFRLVDRARYSFREGFARRQPQLQVFEIQPLPGRSFVVWSCVVAAPKVVAVCR